jgi:hypothetical protein
VDKLATLRRYPLHDESCPCENMIWYVTCGFRMGQGGLGLFVDRLPWRGFGRICRVSTRSRWRGGDALGSALVEARRSFMETRRSTRSAWRSRPRRADLVNARSADLVRCGGKSDATTDRASYAESG